MIKMSKAPDVVLAPAKLTLSLRVTGCRDDGLHLIDAEMITVNLYDTLTIQEIDSSDTEGVGSEDRAGPSILTVRGGDADIPTGPENLVLQALALVGRKATVDLVKQIPSQAGLGGGSSDAGAILRWAGFADLVAAAQLGADVAFCTVGGRARVRGIGEQVESLPFVEKTLTLMTPPVKCPTGQIYQRWDDLGGPTGENGNDLEPAALSVVPELERFRQQLGDDTGQQPRLAGSGSTWFVEGAYPGPGRIVCAAVPE